jgi:endonuclease/exonuclease/phosphatase family metal-dependent hydrolase
MYKSMEKVVANFVTLIEEVKRNTLHEKAILHERDDNMRIMSFNIKWEDGDEADNSWEKRREKVASMIRFHHMDIIGLQEPILSQLDDLEQLLPEYKWVGVATFDGEKDGPFDAILFRKSRFTLIEYDFFFLSETPDMPSKGWGAKYPRAVIWAKFKDNKNIKDFYFFNTHFDYHSQEARDHSALLLKEKIALIAKEEPYIVVGDFNLFPELGGEKTYNLLTVDNVGKKLIDAQKATLLPHHGPTGSWSGFKEAGQPGVKPDYIFVGEKTLIISHGILADTFDGTFPSDHLPVVAELEILSV